MGYPLGYLIACSGRWKNVLHFLVVLPFWTRFLIRTLAMIFLRRDTGLINNLLLMTGWITEPLTMVCTPFAVMIGNLIQNQFSAARNWPFGSAASFIVMALVLVAIIIYMRVRDRTPGGARDEHEAAALAHRLLCCLLSLSAHPDPGFGDLLVQRIKVFGG